MTYTWTARPSAMFPPCDGLGAIVTDFGGRETTKSLYVMGGWNPLDPVNFPTHRHNRIYRCASDAALLAGTWELRKMQAQWSPRHSFGLVEAPDGLLHVFGSDLQDGRYVNDHWSCRFDHQFRLSNAACPWGDRVLFITAMFNGEMLVIGGQTLPEMMGPDSTLVHYTDIWGWNGNQGWRQLVQNCPALPRCTVDHAVVLGDRLYLYGGGTYMPGEYDTEVWRSGVNDLTTWEMVTNAPGWCARAYPNCAAWDGKLWIVGGSAPGIGNLGDTWYSADEGVTWTKLPGLIPARHAAGLVVFGDKLTLLGGNGPALRNDVYQLLAV